MEKEKTSIIKEFQTFISRGNVVDLAVGIIIGAAFTSIVNSLVKDIVMPPIGMILGRVNFSDLRIILQSATTDASGKVIPEVAIAYGSFLQNVFNFLLISLVVFALVKALNAFKKKEEAVAIKKDSELSVLKDIRKILRNKKKA